jgi:cystathionine beta-lyase
MSDIDKPVGDATKVVLAGRRPEWTQGIVSPPVWRASTILYDSVGHLRESARSDTHHRLFYGRKGTPTQWSGGDVPLLLRRRGDRGGVAVGAVAGRRTAAGRQRL